MTIWCLAPGSRWCVSCLPQTPRKRKRPPLGTGEQSKTCTSYSDKETPLQQVKKCDYGSRAVRSVCSSGSLRCVL